MFNPTGKACCDFLRPYESNECVQPYLDSAPDFVKDLIPTTLEGCKLTLAPACGSTTSTTPAPSTTTATSTTAAAITTTIAATTTEDPCAKW